MNSWDYKKHNYSFIKTHPIVILLAVLLAVALRRHFSKLANKVGRQPYKYLLTIVCITKERVLTYNTVCLLFDKCQILGYSQADNFENLRMLTYTSLTVLAVLNKNICFLTFLQQNDYINFLVAKYVCHLLSKFR